MDWIGDVREYYMSGMTSMGFLAHVTGSGKLLLGNMGTRHDGAWSVIPALRKQRWEKS
jgi:hypothetical protein